MSPFRSEDVAALERIEMLERQNRELAERLRVSEQARSGPPVPQAQPRSVSFALSTALAFLLTGLLLLVGASVAIAAYRSGSVPPSPQERDYPQANHPRIEGPRISPAAQRGARGL